MSSHDKKYYSNSNMKECNKCGWIFDDKLEFCPECETENFSEPDFGKKRMNSAKKPMGAWILMHEGKETNPPLYTRRCADDFKHKKTGKKFKRGRYVFFNENKGGVFPQLIENTGEYRIVYYKSIFEKVVIED